MKIVEAYGITICIHEYTSKSIYQNDDESPVIHLIRVKLNNGSVLFLPAEKRHDMNKTNHNRIVCSRKPDILGIKRRIILFRICYII